MTPPIPELPSGQKNGRLLSMGRDADARGGLIRLRESQNLVPRKHLCLRESPDGDFLSPIGGDAGICVEVRRPSTHIGR